MNEQSKDHKSPQESSQILTVSEEYRDRYKASLIETFRSYDISDKDIEVYAINSEDDIEANSQKIRRAGIEAQKGKVIGFVISPGDELFKNVYSFLGKEAVEYTFLPTGIENIANHEKEHFETAEIIKKGNGLSNKYGAKRDFLFCLSILVYPDKRRIQGKEVKIPMTNVGTLVAYDDSMSMDERLAINFEIICAARKSKDGLSPSDIDQIKQILNHRSDTTPITNQVIDSIKSELPEKLFES